MTKKPSASVEYNESLHCGLTSQEIHEGLSGLQNGNFPMRLMTKWVKSPSENWYNDWIAIIQKNKRYKKLKQGELDAICTLPAWWINANWEDQSRERLGIFHYLTDIWCGDGETFKVFLDHIYAWDDLLDKKKSEVTLIDNSWLAIQKASELIGDNVKHVFVKDIFSPSINVNQSKSDSVLCTIFWWMWWNLSHEEKAQLQEKIWLNGGTLKSVFKMPETEELANDTLKAYWWNKEWDNDIGHEVCKTQIWNMLSVLWFSSEALQSCSLDVCWSDADEIWNKSVLVWFIPEKDIVIYHEGKEYKYEAWVSYKVFESQRFSKKSFEKSAAPLPKSRQYVAKFWENDTCLIVLEKNELTKKEAYKKKILENLKLSWLAVWFPLIVCWFLFKLWFMDSGSAAWYYRFQKSGKPDFEYMLTRKGIHDWKTRDTLVAYTQNLTHFFLGAFNKETSRSESQIGGPWGEEMFSLDFIESALIPSIENTLVANTLDSSIWQKSFFDVASDVLDKSWAAFYKNPLSEPKWWLSDADTRFNEEFTVLAPDSVVDVIKKKFIDVPYNNFEVVDADGYPKILISGASYTHQMYNEKWTTTYVYAIKREYWMWLPRTSTYYNPVPEGTDYGFLLYIPTDYKNRFSSRSELIDYSREMAMKVHEFKWHFDVFRQWNRFEM
jgi:hypothetical protein